jgi:uncharacterized membrane protein
VTDGIDPPDEQEVAGLLEDLEETADSTDERRTIRRTIDTIASLSGPRIFGLDDLAQQIVGGFVLSVPFVVTEEVWSLAATTTVTFGATPQTTVKAVSIGAILGVVGAATADSLL